MEDQQPVAGDLSADDAELDAPESQPEGKRSRHRLPRGKVRRPAATEAEADSAIKAASAAADTEAESGVESDVQTEPESEDTDTGAADTDTDTEVEVEVDVERQQIVFVERRPPGRRAPIAIGLAAALFVGAGAFAGAMVQPYLVERATIDTKLEIARTAASAITTLWTYTPENMEQLADRSAKYLAGDFQAQYRKYIDAIVPTNKQAQVTNNTEVVGAAVETLKGPDATAIVYTNSTSTSPLSKNIPSMRYLSYRLSLQRDGADWLVTGMSAITNLDLTPQI